MAVSYYYDSARHSYRIISVEGSKVGYSILLYNWIQASKTAVAVSYYYDSARHSYRIISVEGSKVGYSILLYNWITGHQDGGGCILLL